MRNKLYTYILSILLVLQAGSLSAQLLPKLQQSFNSYQLESFQEKLFVHTDKELYLTGELLWFKVYNVDADSHLPADISKIAYVEILDLQNNPLAQTKIALDKGIGSGSLDLPARTKSGKYKLRAYTNWMKNFGAEVFFEKQISLLNPSTAPDPIVSNPKAIDLQFFPEGGEMVYGFQSKIGFRAIGADGRGVMLKGAVIDNQNDTVARFQTLKFGNGQFTFTPSAEHSYKAVAVTEKGEVLIKELPTPARQGYVMELGKGDAGKIKVALHSNLQATNTYLFVHQGKKTIAAIGANVEHKEAVFQIDESKLPDGISYFTIFSQDGKPVCERLYFKMPSQQLQMVAGPDLMQYSTRQKVSIVVETKNEKNELKSANLSISVRKLDSLQLQDQYDIQGYLWLGSALKGTIESPSYYFRTDEQHSKEAMENLLLTQGWRKFNWSEVLKENKPSYQFLPEYNGHLINGSLKNPTAKLTDNRLVYMGVPGKRLQLYVAKTDALGRFTFNTRDFYGQNEIVVQTNFKEDSTSTVTVQSPFSEQYSTTTYLPLNFQPYMLKSLEQANLSNQVFSNFSATQLKRFSIPKIDTTDFFIAPYKTYKIRDYTQFPTLEEVIREYVREVLVSKRNNDFHMKVIGKTVYLNEDPLWIVDGVVRFNFNKLMMINPNVIEKLEVVRDLYYYGALEAEGILKFTTFKGELNTVEIDPNAVVIDYEGVQLQREFYAPKYESEAQKNSRIPDFRNVLYWSPTLLTDQQGKGLASFYTSDQVGTYFGVVQGISQDGVAGSKFFTFEVKK